jgi:DNA-binding GntR family transcriptional regulator
MKMEAGGYEFLATAAGARRGNITAAVTEALRRAIVSLQMVPGMAIDKNAVAARLGVSRFPVSEALSRLRSEGLVDILPQRGTVVSRVRVADALDYMLIRRALETEAVALLAAAPRPELAAALRANLERQRRTIANEDRIAFHAEDLAFHELLFDALDLPRLKAVIDGARANLDRARQLINTQRRIGLAVADHAAIAEAIAAGRPEAAAAAMRAHLDAVVVGIVAFARQRAELFADGGEDFTARLAALFPRR